MCSWINTLCSFTYFLILLILQMFRESLKLQCQEGVCGVCSMYKPTHALRPHGLQDIPNLNLLKASNESLTTLMWKGESYSLQSVALKKKDTIDVCETCIHQLRKHKVGFLYMYLNFSHESQMCAYIMCVSNIPLIAITLNLYTHECALISSCHLVRLI